MSRSRDDALGQPFNVRTEKQGTTVLVKLSGALGSERQDEVRRAIVGIDESETNTVVLDLRDLTFIDSMGLKVVMDSEKACSERKLEFALIPGTGQVERVFDLSGAAQGMRVIDGSP